MTASACIEEAVRWPALLYFAAALGMLVFLKVRHRLGFGQTLKMLLGIKVVQYDTRTKVLIILALFVPILLLVYLVSACEGPVA